LESPLVRAMWARDTGPSWRMFSSTVLSLMARRRLGLPRSNVACAVVVSSLLKRKVS
jgi:hypothetical protein